jgi:hypothetical protein
VAAALRLRAQVVPLQAADPAQPLTPEQAASRLFDYAESTFPNWFPATQPTQALAPFLFRHYPASGAYLGVVTSAGLGYDKLGVYVLGGPFGAAPLSVGPLSAFLPLAVAPTWLAGDVPLSGSQRAGSVQFFDFASSSLGGDLVVVDGTDPARLQTIETAGEWVPHARVYAADVRDDTRVASGLRERFSTYFHNGRLYRLDLQPPPGTLPASTRLSTLSTLSLCQAGPRVFQDLTAPANAWFVFRAPAEGVSNCYSAWSWRAVRAGMGPDDAPLRLEAPPVAAVRDARGAIEGFIVEGGQRIVLTDASFVTQRVLVDNSAPFSNVEVLAHGVHGRGADRFLLYSQGNSFVPAEQQLRALRLAGGAPVTLFTGAGLRHNGPVIAEDASGLYLTGNNGRSLLHIAPNLATRVVTTGLPLSDERLFLTPSRVVVVAGNMTSNAVVSVPKAGGEVGVIATLSGRGLGPTLATIGEDIYVQDSADMHYGGLHIVRSDGSQHQRLPSGFIAATLRPSAWSLDQAQSSFDHREGRVLPGAEGAGAVLVIDGSYGLSMSGVDIVRYDAGRVRRVLGRLPMLANELARPAGAPEIEDIHPTWTSSLGGRSIAVFQADGRGLLQRESGDLFLVDTAGALHRVTFTEPARY